MMQLLGAVQDRIRVFLNNICFNLEMGCTLFFQQPDPGTPVASGFELGECSRSVVQTLAHRGPSSSTLGVG